MTLPLVGEVRATVTARAPSALVVVVVVEPQPLLASATVAAAHSPIALEVRRAPRRGRVGRRRRKRSGQRSTAPRRPPDDRWGNLWENLRGRSRAPLKSFPVSVQSPGLWGCGSDEGGEGAAVLVDGEELGEVVGEGAVL